MPHYTKKPITINAVRWLPLLNDRWRVSDHEGRDISPTPDWFNYSRNKEYITLSKSESLAAPMRIKTGAQYDGDWVEAHSGDWIILGIEGELYPCTDSVFRKSYEPAGDARQEAVKRLKAPPDFTQEMSAAIKRLMLIDPHLRAVADASLLSGHSYIEFLERAVVKQTQDKYVLTSQVVDTLLAASTLPGVVKDG